MLGIHGKGNQQRRKEDNLKEERTPEFHFQSPAPRGHKKRMQNRKLLKRTEEELLSSFNISSLSRDRRARI
jgi:hypothetical protein